MQVVGGQPRPTEETNEAKTKERHPSCSTVDTRVAVHSCWGPAARPGHIRPHQSVPLTVSDTPSTTPPGTRRPATDKAAVLLVAIHAYDECGTRGDGQKAKKELKFKYLRVTN